VREAQESLEVLMRSLEKAADAYNKLLGATNMLND